MYSINKKKNILLIKIRKYPLAITITKSEEHNYKCKFNMPYRKTPYLVTATEPGRQKSRFWNYFSICFGSDTNIETIVVICPYTAIYQELINAIVF